MKRSRRDDDETNQGPGEESFLDVVANLVGILVILIMVVGMRARGAWQEANARDTSAAASSRAAEVEQLIATQRDRLAALLDANAQAQASQQQLQAEIAMRQLHRDELNVLRVQIEHDIKARRESWSRDRQYAAQIKDAMETNQRELYELRLRMDQLQSADKQTIVLQHTPTPLAQTVFVHEEHFRLLDGRLAYVPLNDLVEDLKREARKRAAQLESADQIVGSVGPRDGFELRFTLVRTVTEVNTRFGPQTHEMGQLAGFELIPVADTLGDPVLPQLQPGSALHQRLASWPSTKTVITVWTYPDSFEELRQLKDYLHQLGYLCAARPLPAGQPITGSPQGTRSAAQ